tara:strand:- start:530 stop:682 length:153 start_codon:yes stop_codon:yes gene_type:complete
VFKVGKVCKGHKESLEFRVFRVKRVYKDLTENKEYRVVRENRECKVNPVR